MSKLKSLSGEDVVKIFSQFGFEIASQKGSHVKLKRVLSRGAKQTLTIPLHKELDKGTLRAIFRQASRYIPEEELRSCFYSNR
ncbi:MAG: type II toxin-antitoxin system HicA family toxin [Chloroflexi bacterium]|nr:type II toxin-antitoxin system HicA family toxin [Chloroflexota bacterium]